MAGEWLLVITGLARDETDGDPRAHHLERATTRLLSILLPQVISII